MTRNYLDPTVLSLFVIAAMGALLGYWMFCPDNPVVVANPTSVKTDKRIYTAGDRIIYTLDYCKTRKIQGRVTRSLVDGIVITYATVDSDLPVGCRKVLVYDLTIPPYTPPGIYHLEVSEEYRVNPLRTASNSWRTEDFEVRSPSPTPLENLQNDVDKNTDDIKKYRKEDKAWQKKHSGLGDCPPCKEKGELACLLSI